MINNNGIGSSLRYWYGASIDNFLATDPDAIFGQLAANCDFNLMPTQRDAWFTEIDLLRFQLRGIAGSIFFEFNIPRMGRRVDVILLIGTVVFSIEFKVVREVPINVNELDTRSRSCLIRRSASASDVSRAMMYQTSPALTPIVVSSVVV
jgi:hypothetical protein